MRLHLLFFLLISVANSFAQTIPPTLTADWSKAGYPDSFPNPSLVFDITNFGGNGNGVFDNATALNDAIDSLHGSRGVIYFPTGNYIIGSTIDLPDSVIIRGLSSDSTHLIFNLNGSVGNGFNITGGASGVFASVLSMAVRGSTAIVVDDPSSFTIGDYCELVQNNGSWDTQPVSWADNSVGQILHLTNISGDTLFFDAPLRINYDTSLNPRIQKLNPAHEVGIECLQLSRSDSVHVGVCINIYFNYAVNCWVKGVESSKSIGSHIEMDASSNITITGCYIHHNFEYDGTSTHGYGITTFGHSGQCLITNNIMKHLRHSFSFQAGANGNVVSYNYSIDPNRSEAPSNFGADISMHGHYPFSNLFEGNIVQNIQIDQTWGPSGPYNTFFRNRAELYGMLMTSGTVQSDSQNFVGNEVTNTTPFFGNYALAGGAHFEFGNNIKGTITPTGTTNLPDSSYYLTGLPSFWSGSLFPSIGLPNTINTGSIPARDRYLSGMSLTVCNEEIINSVATLNENNIEIFPNPASNQIRIKGINLNDGSVITLKDISGRNVSIQRLTDDSNEATFNIAQTIKSGVYLIEIFQGKKKIVKKLVVIR